MNPLNMLFSHIANSVQQNASPNTPGPSYDANPILGALSSVFSSHAQQTGQQFDGYNPNQQYENHGGGLLGGLLGGLFGGGGGGGQQSSGGVQSSDADPYGDPENRGGASYGNVQSSDADPYGDPEDRR